MTIVLPIFFLAVGIGLFARRMTPALWSILVFGILLVIANAFRKGQ